LACTAGTGNAIGYIDPGSTVGTAQVTVHQSAASSPTYGLVFRVQDITNFYMVESRGSGTTSYCLQKKVAGTNTILANLGVAPHAGDVIKVSYSGSTIKVWINGVLYGPYTDSTFTSGTKVGVLGNFASDTTSQLSNFEYWSAAQ